MQKIILIICIILSILPGIAQVPTIQDCLGAIPICTEVYEEMNAPRGSGNYANEIHGINDGGIVCMDDERNSIWYTFTVNKEGDFGFVLTPNDSQDDYDWALFDITKANCSDIYSDRSLLVSCNAAGGESCNGITGADGKSMFNNQGGGCGFNPPDGSIGYSARNALVPVKKGNTYVLLVSNWTGSTNGYKIDFSPSGDLGIFDTEAPVIADMETPKDCQINFMNIRFSENIQLSSILPENFVLHGPNENHAVILHSEVLSVNGTYDKNFRLLFDPPLSEPGDYRLEIRVDGLSDILDLCGNALQSTEDIVFLIDETPLLPPFDPIDSVLCLGSSLLLDVSNPRADSYLWPDSSTMPTFAISKTGTYKVLLQNKCGSVEGVVRAEFVNCDSCHIYIPNAISPNGDGVNDFLEVFSDCHLQDFSISIFNRWGAMVHQSSDQTNCWNGRINHQTLANETFAYIIQYKVQELGKIFYQRVTGTFTTIK
ncbi:MAG: gliding motility-associated C-terminal domain-containing protein [Saprospiraceae bacterium]|nr:gliding motility-associated C-terminal domain-containing protein [Saprospiraceae bacterium]